MKTIKNKMFGIYGMVFVALMMTVIGAFVAVDTQRQHLVLTELLSKQKLLVERVTFSTINASETGLANKERFQEKLEENQAALHEYTGAVDFMLNAFTIKEYPLDGKVVELKFRDEFLIIFDNALDESKTQWLEAKADVEWLLNPEHLSDEVVYEAKLDEFRALNLQLIANSDHLTKICREEATRKRIIANVIQGTSIAGAFIIFAYMVFMMNRDFKQPLEEIQGVFTRMGTGRFDLRLKREREDEFQTLFTSFNHFADSLEAIRTIEHQVLREDSVFDVLSFVKREFKAFASFDKLAIVYQDTNEDVVSLSIEKDVLVEEKLVDMQVYKDIKQLDNQTIVLPIKIHEAYLGYAKIETQGTFTQKDKTFIETLGPTLSFVMYKNLLFRDLLAIVTDGLADLAESRDPETRLHLTRMSTYSLLIAKEMRRSEKYKNVIDDEFLSNIKLTAPMHDIGKISVPDNVLLKPGRLTDEEFDIMKTHAYNGSVVLKKIHDRFDRYNLKYFDMAAEIALCHQEKFNGSGYPNGISGTEIPLSARISALADVFDALTSKRPYKDAFSLEKSYGIIKDSKGTHFDPDVVDAFFETIDTIESTYDKYKEV